jgi:O-antigen/teichoic acid export membrane protein
VTTRASLARGGGFIAPALLVANAVSYVLTVVAARQLNHEQYGELGAYLGVLLVLAVPAIALQAVVARAAASRSADDARPLLRRAAGLGAGLALVVAALSPAVGAFLHSSIASPLWLAVQLAPLVVLCAAMGVLQGAERFTALALVIGAQALGRVCGIVPLLFGGSAADVLAALAIGTVLAAALAIALLRPVPGSKSTPFGSREVAAASGGLLALLLLANLDVLLARNVLSGDQSGRYSAGAVLAKAAFWLPQAVSVVAFPRLVDVELGRALLRRSVALVTALGIVEVLGCLLLARTVLRVTFGASYASLSNVAWLWVVQGAALSLVQLVVYRAIATHDHVVSWLIGVAAVLESVVVLMSQPSTAGSVIVIATVTCVTLTLVSVGLEVQPRRRKQPPLIPPVTRGQG